MTEIPVQNDIIIIIIIYILALPIPGKRGSVGSAKWKKETDLMAHINLSFMWSSWETNKLSLQPLCLGISGSVQQLSAPHVFILYASHLSFVLGR